jgi:hypothetical protein
MGRQIKRVPLDFDWPLHKVWKGFVMPESLHLATCPDCDGEGYSVEARAIAHTFYAHQCGSEALAWHNKIGQAEVDNLVAEDRLCVLKKRAPTPDNPRDWEWVAVPRTAAEVNAENTRGGMGGHDAINRMILIRFRCDRLGITSECPRCDGAGTIGTDAQRKAYDEWKGADPPVGEGWQVWETVSEGSPVSPVYPTKDALIAALIKDGHSRKAAENFAESAWAPSMIVCGGVVKQDIDACEDFSTKESS